VGWKLYERGLINGLDKVYVAAVYSNDNGGMHFNSVLRSLDDVHGKKIRAAGPGEADVIQAVGGTPVSMAITQVAESLNRGVIDGTFNGWSALNTFRITPLIKTHVDMPFGVRAFFMAINKKVYDGLPATARKAIDKNSGLEFSKEHGTHWAAEGMEVRKESAKERIVLAPNKDELKVWSAKFTRFHDAWIKEADTAHRRKLYDATMDLLKALRASS
jgi:TRAP-type C4-dicarboxylate transport system substrate-binding protein